MMPQVLPKNIDAEKLVLGAILIDSKNAHIAIGLLQNDEIFYADEHKAIFEAIRDLFNQHEAIDLLTVSAQLKKNKKILVAKGDFYLIQLSQSISSSAHLENHCYLLLQSYIQRQIIAESESLLSKAYTPDNDALELLDDTYSRLNKLTSLITVGKISDFKSDILEFLAEKPKEQNSGVRSNISKINTNVGGWQKSDLVVLAARPGMGKTAFVLNEILAAAEAGEPVAFFSLEMSKQQIICRMLSILSGINSNRILRRELSEVEKNTLLEVGYKLSEYPIFIDDTPNITPMEFKVKAKKLHSEKGVKLIVVDYLQLMRVHNEKSREREISIISSSIKATAKELDLPIIALSQLSREVEKRPTKRPQLSDLRDSGSIEQDADIVLFIYRPEYYKIEHWDDGDKTDNQAEIEIAKFRNGTPGVFRIGCDLSKMRFMDLGTTEVEKPKSETYAVSYFASAAEAFGKPTESDDLPF